MTNQDPWKLARSKYISFFQSGDLSFFLSARLVLVPGKKEKIANSLELFFAVPLLLEMQFARVQKRRGPAGYVEEKGKSGHVVSLLLILFSALLLLPLSPCLVIGRIIQSMQLLMRIYWKDIHTGIIHRTRRDIQESVGFTHEWA